MHRVNRILTQITKDKNKLYALQAPEVECISKGKARNPYEFGVKVTVATTIKEGFVVGSARCRATPATDTHSKRPSSRSAFLLSARQRR